MGTRAAGEEKIVGEQLKRSPDTSRMPARKVLWHLPQGWRAYLLPLWLSR